MGPYPHAQLYWAGRTMGWMADWTREMWLRCEKKWQVWNLPRERQILEGGGISMAHWKGSKTCWWWIKLNTCCAWAGGACASFPDFCNNRQFYVIYCVYSRLCTPLSGYDHNSLSYFLSGFDHNSFLLKVVLIPKSYIVFFSRHFSAPEIWQGSTLAKIH